MDGGNWIWGASLCWNIGSTIWMYWDKRSDKTAEKLRNLEDRVGALKTDVEKMQVVSQLAPTHDDLGKVYETIKKTDENLNRLIGENNQQSEMLRLIHSFLLNGGKP